MTPSLFAESIYCFLFTVRFIEFGRIIELWEKFFKGGLGTHTPTHTPSYATPFSFTHMQKEKDTKWTFHIWIGEASQRFVLERCCLKISKEFIESSVWQVSIILRHSLGLMVIVTQQALYATKTFCNFCSIWKRPLLIHLTYCEFLQLRTETNAHKLRGIYSISVLCYMWHCQCLTYKGGIHGHQQLQMHTVICNFCLNLHTVVWTKKPSLKSHWWFCVFTLNEEILKAAFDINYPDR